MILYLIIIFLCVGFQAERGVFDFLSYLRLFKQLKKSSLENTTRFKQSLYILIPVLREQLIIEEAILKFSKIQNSSFDIKIAILTSIREESIAGDPTTEEIITESIKSGKLSPYKDRIYIFQDPNTHGNMATQLNFSISQIKSFADSNTFYMVYNADSIINETTFIRLGELLHKYPKEEFAFQQPCAFIKDMHPNSNQFTNAMSLYQSWYCLGHESRIIRNYSVNFEKQLKRENNKKLGVVVGHGSGMTFDLNINNNGYPGDLLTEDLTFGFILSARNVPIFSLPAIEIADVPNQFFMFIKQKSIWFWNFLEYSSCYKKMRKQGHARSQLIPLLIEGISAGAYWFFDTIFILIPFILGIILGSYLVIILAIFSFIIFYITPLYFLKRKLPNVLKQQDFSEYAENVRNTSFIKLLPFLCLIILTNSVGAWIATFKSIRYFFTGKLPVKYKTGN
ncbi:MAG: hypothetical protein A3F47_01505 [Candidatus Staskawiczbacteria bacterium RIFCSPHIGHO2_12_FULL_38_11]|uniref:Glycosyltransferase 2-like domain-containing protein n=1 Tax=Candidatus Staskawiczbacteria bacterium RIFCSPHIGHO2_12_FULL_38_11 TaxID=1802209 RepID=A0A1G2I7A5_9BACT|nr:MAG: hypothetical protein A3F47_01505 [Candidatus Staskawiczbacteria bacterium RIFCSPHIGHO2_12_FULL_38_11]